MLDFTTNLLMFHHAPTLDAFRLTTGMDVQSLGHFRHIDRWIRGCMKYCPQVVDISVYSMWCRKYELPHLGSSSCRLKRLHLSFVTLESCFSAHLRFGCPVLEDLKLDACCTEFSHIQSSTLKNLVIDNCSSHSFGNLVISAPRLASLHLLIRFRNGVSLHEVNSIVEASIDVSNCQISPGGEATLLGGLISVTNLKLRGTQAMAILDKQFDKIPLFNNLKILSLYRCLQDKGTLSDKFKALGRLLQKSPNLEKLTLPGCWFLEGSETETAKQKTGTFLCLKSQDQVSFQCEKLKLIEVKYDGHLCSDHQLFQLLWGLWRNLKNTTIILTKI